jgi:1-acyl-sn-glycerol-3-phosphate acyltransferase
VADYVYPPVVTFARAAFKGLGLKFQVRGTEHIPRSGGAVMAINHTGFLDFTFAGLAARDAGRLVRFMAKREIFDNPIAGPLMRGMKHISVDREAGSASYLEALDVLRRGEIVGVFPESTMSPSFDLLPFKQGTVRMAADAAVPVIPTILWGSQRVLTDQHRKPLTQRRLLITITVGEPLVFTLEEGIAAGTRRLRNVMVDMLTKAQETYPDAPSGAADSWWQPARMGGTAPTPEEGLAMVNARRKESARLVP